MVSCVLVPVDVQPSVRRYVCLLHSTGCVDNVGNDFHTFDVKRLKRDLRQPIHMNFFELGL